MIVWCFAQQRARGGPLDNKLAEDGHYSDREEHFKQALAGWPPASLNTHHALAHVCTGTAPTRVSKGTYYSVKKDYL